MLRQEEGLAAPVLESLGITVEVVRARVARGLAEGHDVRRTGQIPFTPQAKRVLEMALREAISLGHNYIGTEHILLGLVREEEGVPARILLAVGVDAQKVRNEVIRMLGGVRDAQARAGEMPAPLEPDVERLRAERERALEAQDFERAAYLRDRERELLVGRSRDYGSTGLVWIDPPPRPLAAALVVAAVGFLLGVLAGRLIRD